MSAAIYSDLITAISARLQAQVTPGDYSRLVALGFKYKPFPIVETEGWDDLPCIRLAIPDLTETFRPRRIVRSTIDVSLLISTRRSDGVPALVVAVEKVMDALEYNADTGALDPLIGGQLRLPFSWSVKSSFPKDLSVNAAVTIACVPKRIVLRGARNVA